MKLIEIFGLVRAKIRTADTDIQHHRGLWHGQNDEALKLWLVFPEPKMVETSLRKGAAGCLLPRGIDGQIGGKIGYQVYTNK